jgi:hypothetical protein
MSSKSNDNGSAYEYACITQLYNEISKFRNVEIIKNTSFDACKKSWENLSENFRSDYIKSVYAVINELFYLEPLMIEKLPDVLKLAIQKDVKGETGDVRDLIVKRTDIGWEIGLSMKHNHFAVAHNRLSRNIDFGKNWYGVECSSKYWKDIEPIFNYLDIEKKLKTKWKDLPNKGRDVYMPLLNAFADEINRGYENNDKLPERMVEYLLGTYDFYKIVSVDKKKITKIQPFNLHGTLNKPSETDEPQLIAPIVELPTRLVKIEFKPCSTTTIEMYFDRGWQLNFRIHNASTLVEPSLKFDIQLVGMPASIICIDCNW